ncbi:hypothetical protein [Nocardia sp. NPDC059239]|uniref:hypothetical protein n=1 Tax=Nocardia sp. NPDC059239 TaxID=3346785 RepID=UPI0036978A14
MRIGNLSARSPAIPASGRCDERATPITLAGGRLTEHPTGHLDRILAGTRP